MGGLIPPLLAICVVGSGVPRLVLSFMSEDSAGLGVAGRRSMDVSRPFVIEHAARLKALSRVDMLSSRGEGVGKYRSICVGFLCEGIRSAIRCSVCGLDHSPSYDGQTPSLRDSVDRDVPAKQSRRM